MNINEIPASVGMDRLVAERVMGWTNVYQDGVNLKGTAPGSDDQTGHVPFYSADIAAAWRVFESLPRIHPMGNHNMSISWHVVDSRSIYIDGNEYIVRGVLDCGEWEYVARANTAPLAICRAALKTIKEQLNAT